MQKTIKARFKKGVIEPLEKLELAEGEEISVTISTLSETRKTLEAFKLTAGAWKDTVNCDELIREIYESRRASRKRPAVKL